MIVAIEGLPGAGKTTCTRLVSEQLGWPALFEPYSDHPFLGTVYRETLRHNLLIEMQFLLLHFAEYRGLVSDSAVVADFAPAKDLVFAGMVLEGDDEELFLRQYDHFFANVPMPHLTVFIDVAPAECLRRVQVRGREFERNMQLDWLVALRATYMERLAELGDAVKVIEAPGNLPARAVTDEIVNLIGDLQGEREEGAE